MTDFVASVNSIGRLNGTMEIGERDIFSLAKTREISWLVTSIKCGMWDSMYDVLQAVDLQGASVFPSSKSVECETIDVEPSDKDVQSVAEHILEHGSGSSTFCKRDQIIFGTFNGKQAALVGRVGELVAFKYFSKKEVKTVWVNENAETGFPYDVVVGEGNSQEYIEVKATRSAKKDWFIISAREWQFAVEKGDSFCIAYVVLAANSGIQ
ncbi:Protein NO VEIN, C-terminal [Dillenia turbinata]|uniref:Protein NO VEIN, C-terminal n=1 Tax=Dillenia turbinata TaxID=194707 RepID=A0AAN8V897_9MAGN